MKGYETINILDMIDAVGEDETNRILSDFSCPRNNEIETFVREKAIDFARRKMSVTHLVFDEEGELRAIFTLAHKAVRVRGETLSSTLKKKLKRYAEMNEDTNSYTVSAFLIAQFGKNYASGRNAQIDGNSLMISSLRVLKAVQREVGGGVVYLECENKPQLLSFYQNEQNCFRIFGERFSDVDDTRYIQLLRLF